MSTRTKLIHKHHMLACGTALLVHTQTNNQITHDHLHVTNHVAVPLSRHTNSGYLWRLPGLKPAVLVSTFHGVG